VTRIRGYIIDQLRALDWVPRSARQRSRLIERTREEMAHTLERVPTAAEVAAALGLPRAKYEQAVQDAACITVSLDALLHVDDESTSAALLDVVQDDTNPDPGASVEAHDLRDTVSTALGTLSAREQCVLRQYYFEERTLQEISRVLEVSESRTCQIHTRALKRLRTVMAA
jgi:RNA polymerase sigma factor for flagellar operon FliA